MRGHSISCTADRPNIVTILTNLTLFTVVSVQIFFSIIYSQHWFVMIAHVNEKEVYIVDSSHNLNTFYQGLMQSVVRSVQTSCSS